MTRPGVLTRPSARRPKASESGHRNRAHRKLNSAAVSARSGASWTGIPKRRLGTREKVTQYFAVREALIEQRALASVLGHPAYYERFRFRRAKDFGLENE